MTQNELDLLHGYLSGNLAEDDFARLQTLLRQKAEARQTLRSLSTVDTKLQEVGSLNAKMVNLLVMPPPAAPPLRPHSRMRLWSSVAAVAACLALLLGGVNLFTERQPPKVQPDVAATIDSSHKVIASLSVEPASTLPDWISPTASMLDQPRLPQ